MIRAARKARVPNAIGPWLGFWPTRVPMINVPRSRVEGFMRGLRSNIGEKGRRRRGCVQVADPRIRDVANDGRRVVALPLAAVAIVDASKGFEALHLSFMDDWYSQYFSKFAKKQLKTETSLSTNRS